MTGDAQPFSSIAIFGRNDEIWPVAALLGQSLPKHITLCAIEDISAPVPDTALTLPFDSRFHQTIGVTPGDLLRHCNGILGLGYDLRDWQGPGSSFFLAPSGTLPAVNGIALHHLMLRAAIMHDESEKLAYLMQPFRFAARAALEGKFAEHSDDPASPLAMLGPTVQFDRAKYAALLKARCQSMDIQIHAVKTTAPPVCDDNGVIGPVKLDSGVEIKADLFIELSDLLSKHLPYPKTGTKSLADILPFDRLVCGYDAQKNSGIASHPVARAIPGGLLIDTPLQTGTATALLSVSRAIDEQAAKSLAGGNAMISEFAAGYASQPWTKNLLRLGSASAQLGPYLSADMILLHEQILHFSRNIPAARDMTIEATEFNRLHMLLAQQIADFIALPFLLNRRNDTPWAEIQNISPSGNLGTRLNQFKGRGRFVTFDNEIFDEQTWIETMIGFGIVPDRFDPMARSMPMKQLAPALGKMVDDFTNAIDDMPDQADAMAEFLDGE